MESVTGVAPAFSVRETAFLLLEDTDETADKEVEVEVVMHAGSSWECRGPPPLPHLASCDGWLTVASTRRAPAEAGSADDLSSTKERCAITAPVARW